MSELHLHIVSFDIPYPPNYGGVIDVFYKIKALHAAGVKVHLHCFEYHREPAKELDELCEVVHYYPRKTGVVAALSWKPYIVFGRRSDELLKTLCRDDFPILFEGLHSCYYLSHPSLKNRIKIYRESNIEHHYYFHLSKVEKNFFKKIYFIFSGIKLPFKALIFDIHEYNGLLLITLVLVHIYLNWGWIRATFFPAKKRAV